MTDLIPNTSTPNGQQTLVSATGFGNRFHCTADTSIDTISWNRRTAGDGGPASLDIWRVSTAGSVAHVAVSGDTGATGWHNQTLSPAVTLLAGVDYIVGGNYAAGAVINYWTTAPPAIGSGFTVVGARFGGGGAGAPSMPDSVSSVELAAVSVSTAPPPPPPTGGSDGSTGLGDPALTGDLEAWLSADPDLNKRADSLPLLTKALLDAWNSGLGAGAVGYFQFMKTALNAVKERTDRLPDSIEALTNAILTNLSDNTDLVLDGLATIQSGVDALTGGSGGTAGGPLGALSGRSAFPATGWSMADETDFDTDLAWPVAADLYVVTVTTPPPATAADSFAGVTWYHRLGSWTTLDGDQAGTRAFLEFSPQQLQDGGRRMPGLALRTKNGTLGHVQAWLLA